MASPSQKATAFIFSLRADKQGWTDTSPPSMVALPHLMSFVGASVLLSLFSGPVEDGGRGRSVEEPVTASVTCNPVENISKHARAVPGDLGEDLCPQSASSRHKRMHSCSETITGQEIVRLP